MFNEEILGEAYASLNRHAVRETFWKELSERRATLVELLIDAGDDEHRFKIKMIDEVFSIAEDMKKQLSSD